MLQSGKNMKKYTLKDLMQESLAGSDISEKMTHEKLKLLVHQLKGVQVLEEEEGYIFFTYLGKKMALLSDEKYNRMRVISPITKYSVLAPKIKDSLMSANFHSTLDARYSVSEDTLYAAFMHALISLTTEDFLSAIKQVSNLSKNFGSTYSSAQISFTSKK